MTKVVGFTIRLTPEREKIFEKFNDLKWLEKCSVGELLVRAMKEYLEKHYEHGNPQARLVEKPLDLGREIDPDAMEEVREYLEAEKKSYVNPVLESKKDRVEGLYGFIEANQGLGMEVVCRVYSSMAGVRRDTVLEYITELKACGRIDAKWNKLYTRK